jgi:CheY-like chemotaxis protein
MPDATAAAIGLGPAGQACIGYRIAWLGKLSKMKSSGPARHNRARAAHDVGCCWLRAVQRCLPSVALRQLQNVCPAAQASSVEDGLERLEDTSFDVAILDVNLRGQPVWPIADALQEQGRPFVLATGYDGNQSKGRYPQAGILAKPYDLQSLRQTLEALGPANG